MSRISRKDFDSGFFHIMIQGINKEYIFKNKRDKEKYLFILKKYYSQYDVKIIAYCIMDNHAHFIIHTKNIDEMSKYMHRINTLYAIDYNRINKRNGYVFRDRYKSQYIYDRSYLYKCLKYIHMNPVKAGIVKFEQEYKYSSYNDYKAKTEYINDEIIQLVFKNEENYIELFDNINDIDVEIMDIDNDNENFENAIKNYESKNNIKIQSIKKDKVVLKNLILELIEKGYSQKQIAEKLEMNQSKISKIKKKSYPQKVKF